MTCGVSDGSERCWLPAGHKGSHIGRWYTMSSTAIATHEAACRAFDTKLVFAGRIKPAVN